jgi:hypothetical protein
MAVFTCENASALETCVLENPGAQVLWQLDHYEVRTEEDIFPETLTIEQEFPYTVTSRQLRMALSKLNLRSLVDSAVAAGSQDLKDYWEYNPVFDRRSPLVEDLIRTVGKTDADADAVWQLAATL